jgi:uncharacterized oligopeptide transporter (OPT) family protein
MSVLGGLLAMKESHSATIIFLLIAILLVMLFGASSVLMGAGSIVGIGIILAVVVGLLALLGGIIAFLAKHNQPVSCVSEEFAKFCGSFFAGLGQNHICARLGSA